LSEDAAVVSVGAREKYYFLLRRLHSLAGIIPVGAFLFFHLTVNSTINVGGGAFQYCVDMIHSLEKAGLLIPVELATIFLPLGFHAVLGVVIVLNGTPNTTAYRYGGNIRYTLQRVTGMIAFVFIIFHVWQMHWLGKPLGGGFFNPEEAAQSAAGAIQASWYWTPLYVIGVSAAVFHLANGIWTFLITWGVTIGKRSQRISGYVCTAFGLALGFIGLSAVSGFSNFGKAAAPTPEQVAQAAHSTAE
jgi:succinate dehydrogenase / fumarate reductase cytochrome b subunit